MRLQLLVVVLDGVQRQKQSVSDQLVREAVGDRLEQALQVAGEATGWG